MNSSLSLRERWTALPRPQQLALGVGGASLLLLFLARRQVMTGIGQAFDFAKSAAFTAALPRQVARYSTEILRAAQQFNVDPWVLAIIMYRESLGGDALRPPGPTGTGDFTGRFDPKLGKNTSTGWQHADPATGLPPDGLGWGRGLMQIDYGVHIDWFKSGANWRDAQVNINKGAEVFAEKLRFFSAPSSGKPIAVESWRITTGKSKYHIQPWAVKYPRAGQWPTSVPDIRPLKGQALYEAAIAAYNVSYAGVQQAIGLGLPAEAGTTGQDYVSSFLSRLASWQKNFR